MAFLSMGSVMMYFSSFFSIIDRSMSVCRSSLIVLSFIVLPSLSSRSFFISLHFFSVVSVLSNVLYLGLLLVLRRFVSSCLAISIAWSIILSIFSMHLSLFR